MASLLLNDYSMKNVLVFAFLGFLTSSICVQAETEVTVNSGWAFSNAEIRVAPCIFCRDPIIGAVPPFTTTTEADNSPVFGVKVAYFFNNRAGIEGIFSIAPNYTVNTSTTIECPPGSDVCPLILLPNFLFERNMVVYQYDANFVYNLFTGDVEPYVTIGVGGMSSDLDNAVQSDFVVNYGGGAKFWFNNLGLRFEVNDHVIPNYFLTDKTEHNIQLHYGFLFKLN
jgi:hypothetical protein